MPGPSPHRRHRANDAANALRNLLGGDRGYGVILIAAALAAMIAANSGAHDAYHAVFHAPLAWRPLPELGTLHAWINDALMAVFFFVVGLEIKREVLDGQLADPQSRRLPVLAAAAGMAVPALVYWSIAGHDPALRAGWAIPTATDIAFALGVLALLARHAPPALRLFLLSVAIVDDLGAVLIIAVFYTATLNAGWLLASACVLAVMAALTLTGRGRGWLLLPLAVILWLCVLRSGIHATIAGVLAALTIPLAPHRDTHDSLLLRLEHALAPWNGYVIVPLFGFANAGVALGGGTTALAPLPVAIAAGLLIGKQMGILGAVFLADRTSFAARPTGATWQQVWGVTLLCGIGFTMSLFIGGLAFAHRPDLYDEAKIGILGGSLLSTIAGFLVLRFAKKPQAAQSG